MYKIIHKTMKTTEREFSEELQIVSTRTLTALAQGKISAEDFAKRELENRGLDINGNWVGFNNTIK